VNDDRPLVRVVRGSATPEEVAALVTALVVVTAGASEPVARPGRGAWSAFRRLIPGSRSARPKGTGRGLLRRAAS
jgi:Acyl-CoA carboxylase epsilon subunit